MTPAPPERVTYRLVDLGKDSEGQHRGIALATVTEVDGFLTGWCVVDGEYGCANVKASMGLTGDAARADVRAQLTAMLEATSRPILHIDADWRLIERKVDYDPISTPEERRLSQHDFAVAAIVTDSPTVVGQYASCEWDCLDDDGKSWIAAIVRAARAFEDQPSLLSMRQGDGEAVREAAAKVAEGARDLAISLGFVKPTGVAADRIGTIGMKLGAAIRAIPLPTIASEDRGEVERLTEAKARVVLAKHVKVPIGDLNYCLGGELDAIVAAMREASLSANATTYDSARGQA